VRAYYGRHPKTASGNIRSAALGLQPRQRLSPQLQERLSYTRPKPIRMRGGQNGDQVGTPIAAATVHNTPSKWAGGDHANPRRETN